VDGILGYSSRVGIGGVGVRWQLHPDFDLNTYAGIDYAGTTVALGSNVYVWDVDSDVCLFTFKCLERYYFGGSWINIGNTEVTIKHEGQEAQYRQATGEAGLFLFGTRQVFTRQVFPSGFTTGFELGWRFWMREPKLTHVSGSLDEGLRREREKNFKDGLSLGATIGWEI
jgi:hypothetical protein